MTKPSGLDQLSPGGTVAAPSLDAVCGQLAASVTSRSTNRRGGRARHIGAPARRHARTIASGTPTDEPCGRGRVSPHVCI